MADQTSDEHRLDPRRECLHIRDLYVHLNILLSTRLFRLKVSGETRRGVDHASDFQSRDYTYG
jgi:hypothetical protein